MDGHITIEPRPYQKSIIKQIKTDLLKGLKHLLVVLPTGGGKTVIFTYIASHAALKSNKTLILTDREELLKQASGTMSKFGIHCGLIKGGTKIIDHRKDVFVAMSQTLRRRINLPEWRDFILNDISMIIIDEAHIQEFNFLFEDGILDKKIVLGFTATPSRTGKMRQLGLDYNKMIQGPTVKELINEGFLVNADTYEIKDTNTSNLKVNAMNGDFDTGQMFERFNSPKAYRGLIKAYEKFTPNTKMIVFCVNVEHAIKTTIELCNSGISAKFVASEKSLPKKPINENDVALNAKYLESMKNYEFWKENHEIYSGNRKGIFDGFHNNEFDVLVNVDIATKGYDEPSILTVAVMRATQSMCLWRQMIGRGSRLFENKYGFTILDFGNNKERLGDYDSNVGWSLWHEESKSGGGIPPLKTCGFDSNGVAIKSGNHIEKGCEVLIIAGANICPLCGFKYPEKDEAKEVELELSGIVSDEGIKIAVKPFKEMSYDELELYRSTKKHKQPWLWRQLWYRGGENEIKRFGIYKEWKEQTIIKAINYCKSVL